MREARTIFDLRDLFRDYSVTPVREGNKVFLIMEPTEEWEPDSYERGQIAVRSRTVIPGEPEEFQRTAHNAIVGLVFNPQFMRCTNVANQMSIFYGADGGSCPPMFMRGEGRLPSRRWRMTGLTKRRDEPFTIHFENEGAAITFLEQFNGQLNC